MVEAHRVVLKYAARGAKQAQRADQKVRDTVRETARIAKRKTGEIQQWFQANRQALIALGAAMTGVMAGIISNSPALSAEMSQIRLAFSLIAMEIGQVLAPAFQFVGDLALDAADAFSNLPGPVKSAISWMVALAAVIFGGTGLLAALQAVWGFLSGTFIATIGSALVGALSTAWGWFTTLASGIAGSTAAVFAIAAAIGAAIGTFAVWILEITGVLDKIEVLGRWVGSLLPGWLRDLSLVITGIVGGAFVALGAIIVGFVRDGLGGVKREIGNLIDIFRGPFNRTINRAKNLFDSLADKAAGLGQRIVNGIQSKLGDIGTAARSIFNRFSAWVGSLPGSAYTWASAVPGQIFNAVRDSLWRITNAARDIWQKFKNWVGGLASDAWSWGWDFINFFLRGINSRIQDVEDLARDIKNKVKEHLGFDLEKNDRMARRWGEDLALEFSKGLQRGADTISMTAEGAVPGQTFQPNTPPSPVPSATGGGGSEITILIEEGAIRIEGGDAASINEDRIAREISEKVKRDFGGRSL